MTESGPARRANAWQGLTFDKEQDSMSKANKHPTTLSRRAVLAGATAAAAVPALASGAVAADHPDAAILKAAARWLELDAEHDRIAAERERLMAQIPARFDAVKGLDPRGIKKHDFADWEHFDLCVEYEPVYVGLGLGKLQDRGDELCELQGKLEETLIDNARPKTVAGAVAVARVGVAMLALGRFDDEMVGPYAVAARDALALAARLAGTEA